MSLKSDEKSIRAFENSLADLINTLYSMETENASKRKDLLKSMNFNANVFEQYVESIYQGDTPGNYKDVVSSEMGIETLCGILSNIAKQFEHMEEFAKLSQWAKFDERAESMLYRGASRNRSKDRIDNIISNIELLHDEFGGPEPPLEMKNILRRVKRQLEKISELKGK